MSRDSQPKRSEKQSDADAADGQRVICADVTAAVTAVHSAVGHELGNTLHPMRAALEATQKALRSAGVAPAHAPDVWDAIDRLEECVGSAFGVLERLASLALADERENELGELAAVNLAECAALAVRRMNLQNELGHESLNSTEPLPAVLARARVVEHLVSTLVELAVIIAGAPDAVQVSTASDAVKSTLVVGFPGTREQVAELEAALDPFAESRPNTVADRHVVLLPMRAIAGRMNGDLRVQRAPESDDTTPKAAFRLSFVRADVLSAP